MSVSREEMIYMCMYTLQTDRQTCNEVHGNWILCRLENGVEEDTTFSYREDSHQKLAFCIVYHGGKAPLPSYSLDTDNVENGTEMHAPEDQASS